MGKAARLQQEHSNKIRQEFLASFFVGTDRNHLMCNGFHLIRSYHGITGQPVYMIYNQKSYENAMRFMRNKKALETE